MPSSARIFEPILFFLPQKEKNGFNLPRKERGPVPTVVLNLTQKISAIIRPLRQSLPSERSLRSAHRLSAEPRSKTNTCGPMKASAPTKSIVDSPTSIRRKSRARLWSIEGTRGNHPKGFPGLFSFVRRFLFGAAKRKCRPFPLSWKKQTKKTMWTPNRLGISKNSARWRKNTEKARKIPNHFKNIPCFFRQRVV